MLPIQIQVKNGLFEPFIYKTMILPRQARDRHRENSQQRAFPHQTQIQMRSMRSCLVSSSFPQKKS